VDLETFLGELHHADSRESAVSIAAYLKNLEQAAAQGRPAKKRTTRSRRKQSDTLPTPPPTVDATDDPMKRAGRWLFVWPFGPRSN